MREHRKWPLRMVHTLSGLFLLLVLVQFYAAGIFAFGAGGNSMHALLGWGMLLLALPMLIGAILTWQRPIGLGSLGLLLLLVLQPVLAFGPRATMPLLSALHVPNAL